MSDIVEKVTKFDLEMLITKYKENSNKPIAFNFKQASSYIANNNSNNKQNNHYIHYYPGRIFPYIPFFLLSMTEFKHLDGYLLDPFSGSGTILLEAIINPIVKRNALGVEINPIARLISKVKTTPLNMEKITQYIEEIVTLHKDVKVEMNYIPKFKNRKIWFSYNATKKLCKLRYTINALEVDSNYKDFFWLCFSSIIRKVAKADPYIPPPVILKPEKYKDNLKKYIFLKEHLKRAERPNIIKLFKETVDNNKKKLDSLNKFKEITDSSIKAEIIWDNAQRIKRAHIHECGRMNKNNTTELETNSVDIILTSPPYITAQKYIRTNKLELFWLGYTEKEVGDIEKESIGTERIQKDYEIYALGIKSIDLLLDYTLSLSFERAQMVYKYFKDMIQSLKEMHRLLNRDGYLILIVGDNKVLEKKVDTYRLLADAAKQIGFIEIVTLYDTIRSRSMMTKRNGSGGLIKNEYVVIFKKGA
jgi:DNA modification methylase